jgi:hypothetical protein
MATAQQDDKENGANDRDGDRTETPEAIGEKSEHRCRFIVFPGGRGCS